MERDVRRMEEVGGGKVFVVSEGGSDPGVMTAKLRGPSVEFFDQKKCLESGTP